MFQIEQEGQRQVNEEEKEQEKNHRNDKVGWDIRLGWPLVAMERTLDDTLH